MLDKQSNEMKELVIKLHDINAFKFGDFKMKVGINSPVYFDLRVIVSYPEVMESIGNFVVQYMKDLNLEYEHLCGVPYTALPIATIAAVKVNKSMLVRRKEVKTYGTKKAIEGKYNVGDNCLIIEDIITSGSSILETVESIRNEGVTVTDAIVIVDREQGGKANIAEKGVRVHTLFTLSYMLNVLKEVGRIQEETVQSVNKYIQAVQIKSDGSFVNGNVSVVNTLDRTTMPFEERAGLAKSNKAKLLFNLMAEKKTNLCLACDVTDPQEILDLAENCGPYICCFKTHMDIVDSVPPNFTSDLCAIAKRHNFFIMEDRKFSDIGNTVALQLSRGPFKISQWADFVTAHSLPGQGVIKGIKAGLAEENPKNLNVFLLAEMSCQGNLIDEKYKEQTIKMATESTDIDVITGIVCQSKECFAFPGLIQLTPGVKINENSDDLGQQYNTPDYVVKSKGADIGVVGRGILKAKSPEKAAVEYRDALWAAYKERTKSA